MTFTPEQLLAAQKANVETLFGLTNKAFEGVEKLVELNLQVAKTALAEAAESTKAVMSVKDAQELLALQASLLQPSAEKAAAYSRHLYDILAGTNAEVTKVAEATIADAQKKVLAAGRHRRQERPGRHRERRGAGEVGRGRRQQRLRKRAQGCQAGRRSGRIQLPGHDHTAVKATQPPPRPSAPPDRRTDGTDPSATDH
jgi:phasin family protein